jgi:hypothetical protein
VKVVTGLSASTTYYVQGQCGAGTTRATVTTLGAPAGTASVSVSAKGVPGASTIEAEWATTATGSYTAGTPVACSAGSTCSAAVTADNGLAYVRHRIKNGGGTTIALSPPTALSVQ